MFPRSDYYAFETKTTCERRVLPRPAFSVNGTYDFHYTSNEAVAAKEEDYGFFDSDESHYFNDQLAVAIPGCGRGGA